MRCAVISDIHSNKYALAAVLKSIQGHGVDLVINSGDTFGYYPWAQEVFELIEPLAAVSVLGNHDALIRQGTPPESPPSYWDAIEQNRKILDARAHRWLQSLAPEARIQVGRQQIRVVHGTPDAPLSGRLYSDDPRADAPWFPASGEVLVLGHTHYPLVKKCTRGGLLLNPGSVGQPRDGDPRPSWMLLDVARLETTLFRVNYDIERASYELRASAWNEPSVRALNKAHSGPLRMAHPTGATR